jgi:HD-GYP domain-containing protein (c-di-GMP phosphodiesterase class II)
MLRVPLNKIEPGMILARPIPLPDEPYRYLLQRDREIPLDLIPRLKRLGVLEVWVRHRDLEFLEDVFDPELGQWQRELYLNLRRNLEAAMWGSSLELHLEPFQVAIGGLFQFLQRSPTGNVLLQKLDAFDNYLLSHSTNICYLAMLIGMRLERYLIEQRRHKTAREAKNLHLLGLGCLLHDVGKIHVPREILEKPGRLTPDEMSEMRRHTLYGYQMVRGVLPAPAAQIALNHHQRWDGSGYPAREDPQSGTPLAPLAGPQIPIFSRIAILADVYDAATTQRCYSPAKPAVQVLHEMRSSCRGFFDPVVAAAFFRTVPPFPIGQVVTLSDGTEAVVVDFNPDFPTRPKIRGLRAPNGERFRDPALEEWDLALYPELSVAMVNGQDVRPFLAAQETPLADEYAMV